MHLYPTASNTFQGTDSSMLRTYSVNFTYNQNESISRRSFSHTIFSKLATNQEMAVTRFISLKDIKTLAPTTKLINNIPVSTSDVQTEPSRNLWFRLFTPTITPCTELPLIVYFHGGGFRRFAPDTKAYDDFCSNLAANVPAVIVSANYRLAPKHKWPSQPKDGYHALKFINDQSNVVLPAYTDLDKCFIGGDCGGANIAHHVAIRALKEARLFDKIRIVGFLSLQPAFVEKEPTESELRLGNAKWTKRMNASAMSVLPEGLDRTHPAINAIGSGSEELMKNLDFPPTLVIVGGKDPFLDVNKRYAAWLKSFGTKVELTMYPNVAHAFYVFPELPEFELLLQRLKIFIQKTCHQ